MRQLNSSRPYLEAIGGTPTYDAVFTRWDSVAHGSAIATPSKRRDAGEKPTVNFALVKAISVLAGTGGEAEAKITFSNGSDPALVVETTRAGRNDVTSFRTRDRSVLNTSQIGQGEAAAIVFAACLLIRREPDFAAAYGAFLDASSDGKTPDDKLAALIATASDELAVGIENDLDLDEASWFTNAGRNQAGEIDEADDPGALNLGKLFSDPTTFRAYQASEPTDFDVVTSVPGTVNPTISINIDPNGFVGPQRALAERFMREGMHVLYHGPTGTGKTYLWDLAMAAVEPDFDANTYPYFVHGSAGLEDIDFTGNYVLRPNGTREWVDGPLVRAMKNGKRFKVEEMNRMPAPMLNVLLGAMDYGRITLPRYDGQIVIMKEGFAVDAMANIGREYVGTDEIDPAILRRFQIKIEFDYLPRDQEVALLRSRYPNLDGEDAETLVAIGQTIRDAYENGSGTMEVDMAVSPAGLLNSARLVANGLPTLDAIELTWLADVAHTKAHRESVRSVIDMHLRERRNKRRSKKPAAAKK